MDRTQPSGVEEGGQGLQQKVPRSPPTFDADIAGSGHECRQRSSGLIIYTLYLLAFHTVDANAKGALDPWCPRPLAQTGRGPPTPEAFRPAPAPFFRRLVLALGRRRHPPARAAVDLDLPHLGLTFLAQEETVPTAIDALALLPIVPADARAASRFALAALPRGARRSWVRDTHCTGSCALLRTHAGAALAALILAPAELTTL